MPAVNRRGSRYFVRYRLDGRQTCSTFDTYEEAADAARALEAASAARRSAASADRLRGATTVRPRRTDPATPESTRLPAGPLLCLVDQHGATPPDKATSRALTRARREGTVTPYTGDRLAIRLLGLTALEVWGDQYAGG